MSEAEVFETDMSTDETDPPEAGTSTSETTDTSETGAAPPEAVAAEPGRRPSEVLRRHRWSVAALVVIAAPAPALRAGWSVQLAPALLAVLFAVPLAAIDMGTRRLPNRWLAAWAALLAPVLAAAALAGHPAAALRGVLAAALLAVCYFLLYVVSRGGVGMGDVKVMALVGATLGARSWGAVLGGLMAGSLLALLAVPWMIRTGRRSVAYGPFVLAGMLLTLALAPV